MMKDKGAIRIGPLTSVGRVAIELGRLYRKARRGEVETIEAYRLASVLSVLKSCLETTAMEERLAELEAALAQRNAEAFKPKIVA